MKIRFNRLNEFLWERERERDKMPVQIVQCNTIQKMSVYATKNEADFKELEPLDNENVRKSRILCIHSMVFEVFNSKIDLLTSVNCITAIFT